MSNRIQTGQLVEASGSIYIRFYNDQGRRTMKRLCAKDDKHYGLKARSVKLLQQEFMAKINAPGDASSTMTIPQFWEWHYLPYIQGQLKPSTIESYVKLWTGTLADHFRARSLSDYKTSQGSEFLTSLTDRMTRTSIAHVRSLCSAIFSLAINKGLIDRNPWKEVKVLARQRDSEPTGHYTLDEALEIIKGLAVDQRAQTAFGLCFFLALRPGELAALRFEDFDKHFAHIKQSSWKGHVGTTKTTESATKIPLISQARELFEAYQQFCGNPDTGWLFPGRDGRPLDMSTFGQRVLRPMLGNRWKVLYGCRRGISTALTELTGNAVSSQGLLRHKSLATTLAHYKKETPQETLRGMRMLEKKITQSRREITFSHS